MSTCPQENDEEESSSFDMVQAEFEFFDPTLDDVAAIRRFLRGWLGRDDLIVDTDALAKRIAEQDTVGTVIRVQDSTDCLGFITCLNAKYVWKWLSPLFQFLRQRFESINQLAIFEKCGWHQPEKLGVVISERVVNLPGELSPWLQQALMDELEWATEDEPTEERRQMFALEYFLYITQVYISRTTQQQPSRPPKRKKPRRNSSSQEIDWTQDDILFIKAEDRVVRKKILWKNISWQ
ncbi:hypothetical protein GAYE_SCF53G6173 [Galdieria yellowstonensis]|uniref:Uncharacterized protein n=1 Tax=Galdieria yellowstonensis TaxID=3028027 RepID=A0AAV9ILR6_9RHOD|nr:hypothetical protein GAYE_SCF53G6173 [Galdieria yellowstonensis]